MPDFDTETVSLVSRGTKLTGTMKTAMLVLLIAAVALDGVRSRECEYGRLSSKSVDYESK